jgi:hypothetical protein
MGNGKSKDPVADFMNSVKSSNITGSTWKEFNDNLQKHFKNTSAIDKEWEVSTNICIVSAWKKMNNCLF